MRRIGALLLVAGALANLSCGDDEDEPAAATTSEATTTTARRATTTTGAAATTTCPPPSSDAISTVDLDGDGVDERWVPAGRGAAVDIVELRRLDACEEVAVTLEGSPAQFAVGGSVLLLQGVRCEGDVVVHLGATSEDGERYVTLDVRYELRDGALVRVGDRSGELSASDPDLADYSSFDC